MPKRMLIDGTHPEELRVVVMNGKRLEEFDVETSTKKQIKGNIYLAKVTRVEPSLQAAFVDYGGNRHGFLAFNEIHPDYYQIPIEDRRALMQEHAALELNATAAQAHVDEIDGVVRDSEEHGETAGHDDTEDQHDANGNGAAVADRAAEDLHEDDSADAVGDAVADPNGRSASDAEDDANSPEEESAGHARKRHHARRYKIQEVIRRRQILLVQVVKEERGNKGAALTTYISLAGRYCVLMPNTGRGGGISRKVTNTTSRRKLRDILNGLGIPEGMGVIMRTAGMERSKSEIKRDFEYLLRTWDSIRELTLQSTAPTLIYEEGSLIKRAIRDIYTKDMEEVLVEGNDPYQIAKKFMRLLMPSHAKRVQPYRDESIPLFHRFQVESQLDAMLDPVVQLKSGGYIVLHSTEALVAIDVNSGRSTRERNIEETALKTNLEAAHEVARQLRLRDLAGLIVIDFIDMEVPRNPRKVEKALKEAMAADRARIQIGRISSFGLLELSRQRLRSSLQEASTEICRHCGGVGYVRSTESMAVRVLRALEEEGIRQRSSEVSVTVPTSVALYILNRKRANLTNIERRYGFSVTVEGDDDITASEFKLHRTKARSADETAERVAISMDTIGAEADREEPEEEREEAEEEEAAAAAPPPRSRKGRRARKVEAPAEAVVAAEPEAEGEAPPAEAASAADEEHEHPDRPGGKRRRRGRRGGRRRSRRTRDASSATAHEDAIAATFAWAGHAPAAPERPAEPDRHAAAIETTFTWTEKPARARTNGRGRPQAASAAARERAAPAAERERAAADQAQPEASAPEPETSAPEPEPTAEAPEAAVSLVPETRPEAPREERPNGEVRVSVEAEEEAEPVPHPRVSNKPKRRGWWQRLTE